MNLLTSILGALVIGFCAGLASLAALWVVDRLTKHFARTEIDDTERADAGGHVNVSMRLAPFVEQGDLSQLDRWDGLGRAPRSGGES